MDHDQGAHERPPGFWTSRYVLGLLVIGPVAAYFLLTERLAHVVGALPFLLLLAGPLTIYLLSHDTGHLWSTLLGEKGNPHFGVLHIASYILLASGFILLFSAWNVLYLARRERSNRTAPQAFASVIYLR